MLEMSEDIRVTVRSKNARGERRINLRWTGAELAQRLETITGIPSESQRLKVYAGNHSARFSDQFDDSIAGGVATTKLDSVAALGIAQEQLLIVLDARPREEHLLLDDSSVQKFELPQAQYEQREDSVLNWKKRLHLGRFSNESIPQASGSSPARDPERPEAVETSTEDAEILTKRSAYEIQVGDRVQTDDKRTGTVRFVGPVPEIPGTGIWIGVEFDDAVGKNDGSIGGSRYFECRMREKHADDDTRIGDFGGFLRPHVLTVMNRDSESTKSLPSFDPDMEL